MTDEHAKVDPVELKFRELDRLEGDEKRIKTDALVASLMDEAEANPPAAFSPIMSRQDIDNLLAASLFRRLSALSRIADPRAAAAFSRHAMGDVEGDHVPDTLSERRQNEISYKGVGPTGKGPVGKLAYCTESSGEERAGFRVMDQYIERLQSEEMAEDDYLASLLGIVRLEDILFKSDSEFMKALRYARRMGAKSAFRDDARRSRLATENSDKIISHGMGSFVTADARDVCDDGGEVNPALAPGNREEDSDDLFDFHEVLARIDSDAAELLRLKSDGKTLAELGERFGVSESQMSRRLARAIAIAREAMGSSLKPK